VRLLSNDTTTRKKPPEINGSGNKNWHCDAPDLSKNTTALTSLLLMCLASPRPTHLPQLLLILLVMATTVVAAVLVAAMVVIVIVIVIIIVITTVIVIVIAIATVTVIVIVIVAMAMAVALAMLVPTPPTLIPQLLQLLLLPTPATPTLCRTSHCPIGHNFPH